MKDETGFTLVELLITILVASILMAVAVPAFNDFIWNNRIVTANNLIVNALATARSSAIHRRETVTLCSSVNLTGCANNTSWETGWIIFSDSNGNRAIDGPPGGTDVILRVWEPLANGITLTDGTVTHLQFDRLGDANAFPAGSPLPAFSLTNPDCLAGQANRERTIALVGAGSVNSRPVACP